MWCRSASGWIAGAAVAVALIGCGGDGDKTPEKPGLRFSGGEIPGTLYLLAGESELNADLYRARGALGRAQRLTEGGRISWVTAQPGAVVTANARGSGNDRVETLDLSSTPARPGRVLDPAGQAPALSPSRRVAYSVVNYRDGGETTGSTVFLVGLDGGARRPRYRARADLTPEWLPGDRLAVLSQPDLERPDRARLVLDAGGPRQRTVDPGVPRATVLLAANGGTMLVGAGVGRAAIVTPDGAKRFITTDWSPRCWAPDGRALLAVRGARLGLLAAGDGRVRDLGRITGGRLVSCAWTA
jgi:hypothetical protein